MPAIEWRPYGQERDAVALAARFLDSVTTLTAAHYDAAQRAAWVSSADDVAPGWTRRGLATAVLARLETVALGASVLDADASGLARPVFERAGFLLVSEQTVWRGGVSLSRFQLCKPLRATDL